jgi:hypothetical protein
LEDALEGEGRESGAIRAGRFVSQRYEKISSEDMRPRRYGWAPGSYLSCCGGVGCKDKSPEDQLFMGDKRAIMCADCAYALRPIIHDLVDR